MNKVDLLKNWQPEVKKRLPKGLTYTQLEQAYDSLMVVIGEELVAGGEITLPSIGKLKTKDVPARKGRNPATGEGIDIPAKRKPVFVASSLLKEQINQ